MTGKLEQYYKQNNIKEFTKQSLKIHFKIWETYENKTIAQELIQACERVSILENRNLSQYYTPKVFYKSYLHHCDLMDALEEKNLKKAKKVLKSHFSEEYLKE